MGAIAILKDKRLSYFGIVMITSMIYEVAWVRMFTLNFGITVYVSSVVIAAFMGGISIGAYAATLTKRDPSKLFQQLQIILGAYSLVLLFTYTYIFSLILVFILLLIPTSIIGASYSLINQILIKEDREIAVIYAVDTFSAGVGALMAGFVMLPFLGIKMTVIVTAIINLLIALVWIEDKKDENS
jgi:spermidine synthase